MRKKRLLILVILIIILTVIVRFFFYSEENNFNTYNNLSSGVEILSLEINGLERTYQIYLPRNYERSVSSSAVIYLHGGGGSVQSAYLDRMDEMAERHGFILVVPAGTGPLGDRLLTWNSGNWGKGGCCGYALENNVDDVAFISKIIDEVKNLFSVKEVYITGISNGGAMSYRLACELPEKISGVAPVAPPGVFADCHPENPVPVIHIHGKKDPCTPYQGGEGGGCLGRETFRSQSAEAMINKWKDINSCSENQEIFYGNSGVLCTVYINCASEARVSLCTIEEGGHTWPGGNQYLPERRIGPVTSDMSFDQIWDFFEEINKK